MARETGSSPRVRGTQMPFTPEEGGGRFIPTRAGNTTSIFCKAMTDAGSSPRVRGTHQQSLPVLATSRFIPTRAGNTLLSTR